MKSPPNLTPLIPAPKEPSTSLDPARKTELKAPIVVVAASGEWEHSHGAMTIGRDAASHVPLTDPLVSRLHAQLLVQPNGHVVLEDLHSSNGVFVNGKKLSRPLVQLYEGDRLLVGTTEISVFSLRASAKVPLPTPRDPKTPPQVSATMPSACEPAPVPGNTRVGRQRAAASTARADAIEIVGQLADQLVSSGHQLEAIRVLSGHLQSLLQGASVGLTVPAHILEVATQHALRLNELTDRSSWVDYVFELHLACKQLPNDTSLTALEAACAKVRGVDRSLIHYLINAIESRGNSATPEETSRLQRLTQLAS